MLPRLQYKPLPGPFTFGMFESLDKTNGSGRCLPIEVPTFIQRIPEVVVVTLDRQLHQLASEDASLDDILCILLCF